MISIPGSQLIQHTTCLQNPYWFYLPSNSVRDFSRKSMIQSCKFLKTGLSSDHNLTPPHAYHARTSTRIPSTQGTHGAKVPRQLNNPLVKRCQTAHICSHLFTVSLSNCSLIVLINVLAPQGPTTQRTDTHALCQIAPRKIYQFSQVWLQLWVDRVVGPWLSHSCQEICKRRTQASNSFT